MSPRGRHLIIDYWDCDPGRLTDEAGLVAALTEAAEAAGATIMSTHSHPFADRGVTAVVILAESHISIHTWPEVAYAGVDIYTCGEGDPMPAHHVLVDALGAGRSEVSELTRGATGPAGAGAPKPGEVPARPAPADDSRWFVEGTVPGRRHGNVNHGFRITDVVFEERTRFQDCLIFDNPVYGRVLALDGIVQLSTADEHIYHEMLVHPAMFAHPAPRRVCIVGGGDGGTLREVLKHDPAEVVMIDIDEEFVGAAREHLPGLSDGAFDDPRVTLIFEDASEALRRYRDAFDVAVIDCNDAMGPSEALFDEAFYATVARSLKEDGVCAVQTGSLLDTDFVRQTSRRMERALGRTVPFRLTVPSYHCGDYVFLVAARSLDPAGPAAGTLAGLQDRRGGGHPVLVARGAPGEPDRSTRDLMADGSGRTVVILRDRPAPPMTYAVDHFAARWRAAGHRVLDHIGPTGIPDADVVVVHIDLTVVPPEYVDAIGALSGVVVNGEVLDISRRRFSRLLVSRDDDYAGPVIVKTNANYGGRPEWEATDPAAPPPIPADKFARPKGMRPKGLRSFLRRSRLGQTANRIRRRETVRGWDAIETLSPENYPIFEGIDSVPAGVWENDHLVAERFIGHPEGGLFYTHYCSFFGDREIAGRLGSPDPIVKFYNAASDVELPVPDAVRRWRDELRIDAGRFDYLEADGEYYLIDVNKTEGGGSINDKFPAEMDFLAAGLDSFLSPPGSPGESA